MKTERANFVLTLIVFSAFVVGKTYAAQSRNAGGVVADTPPGTQIVRNIVYSHVADRQLLLDLYLPAKRSAQLAVIIWVHGRSWCGGTEGSSGLVRSMLERGYAVVDVGYRFSGEANFPTQIEGCKAVVRWVRANADKYNLDSDRIGAWGSSAGGHLAALLGTTGYVREFDTETNAQYSSRVQAVCDWCGPTDFLQMDKHSPKGDLLVHNAPSSPESQLVGGAIQDEPYRSLAAKANPITYVTNDDPLFLIMHGDKDMVVPLHQSELLFDALKKARVYASLYVVKGAGHSLRGGEANPEQLYEIVADFFDRQFRPTYADVKYGPYDQNKLDFYQAKFDEPTPLVVYIHGGGFRRGSKKSLRGNILRELLDAGISVAAVEYRFISDAPLPAAHHDCRQALQFLRSKADHWNIDKTRIGAFGGSAGAVICMWLAFHDDMADRSSGDPVQRESSRLTCVAAGGGPTTIDIDWWMQWIPGYDKPDRDIAELFGGVTDEELRKVVREFSALSLITADDPPIFLFYEMRPDAQEPTDSSKAWTWKSHHVMFGVKLKEKMDELGVEADLKYPDAKTTYLSYTDFFIRKLKAGDK